MLIIAHRLHTILHCDKVLVMDDGQVAEYDAPSVLLQDDKSKFYGLVHHWEEEKAAQDEEKNEQ